MKFAIIAAGEGSRLGQEGVTAPKPLVKVNGKSMIDRAIEIFDECDASEIIIIINDSSFELHQHLEELKNSYPIRLIVKNTKGSMESFSELAPYLKDEPFCLTTVDAIYNEVEFAAYIENFKTSDADAFMAVTNFVDDEKPLYISTDDQLRITGYYDTKVPETNFISGGIYCMRPDCLSVLQDCLSTGLLRMRQFQRELVKEGKTVMAYPFSKIIDVDHADDICKAEDFLNEPMPIIGISRGSKFSPNRETADFNIFKKVKDELNERGFRVLTYTEERFMQQPMLVDTYFSMARSENAVKILKLIEKEGDAKIINSPDAVRKNCNRKLLYDRLTKKSINYPKSVLIHTDIVLGEQPELTYPCWIKRNDSHAELKEDVSFINTPEEAEKLLTSFKKRGIREALASIHIEGDLLKFYGVGLHRFFYWYYPDETLGKFGLEKINGKSKGLVFSEDELRNECENAAREMHLDVYGGDAIVSADGKVNIIDLNDWPSFGLCQEEAAPAIADLIINQ